MAMVVKCEYIDKVIGNVPLYIDMVEVLGM